MDRKQEGSPSPSRHSEKPVAQEQREQAVRPSRNHQVVSHVGPVWSSAQGAEGTWKCWLCLLFLVSNGRPKAIWVWGRPLGISLRLLSVVRAEKDLLSYLLLYLPNLLFFPILLPQTSFKCSINCRCRSPYTCLPNAVICHQILYATVLFLNIHPFPLSTATT